MIPSHWLKSGKRWKELNPLKHFATNFILIFILALKITLAGITSYKDFYEVRSALAKTDGLKLSPDTEAPGLLTYTATYQPEATSSTADSKSLVSDLSTALPKFSIQEKKISSGISEILISLH